MSNPDYLPPEDNEVDTEMAEPAPSTLSIITQSEHAAMVATANMRGNKRNIDDFTKTLMQYANHSQPIALSMFYTLPRANKQIVGASVRFAELVAPCWKNNSTGSRLIGTAESTVTAQGVFVDYERNLRNVKEVPRRITDSSGRRFNDDMVLTTAKAGLSIAYREAILKGGVPMALWAPSYEEAKLTAVGKAISHSARIDAAMEYLNKLGVTEWQIMNAVSCPSPKDLDIDQLVTLRALCDEIKKGQRSIEEVFGSEFDKEINSIFEQVKMGEAERRTLRLSYRGRAKDLLENLRSRIAHQSQGKPVSTAPASENKVDDKKTNGKGKGKKDADKPTPEASASTEVTAETQAATEAPAEEQKKPDESGSLNLNF